MTPKFVLMPLTALGSDDNTSEVISDLACFVVSPCPLPLWTVLVIDLKFSCTIDKRSSSELLSLKKKNKIPTILSQLSKSSLYGYLAKELLEAFLV